MCKTLHYSLSTLLREIKEDLKKKRRDKFTLLDWDIQYSEDINFPQKIYRSNAI